MHSQYTIFKTPGVPVPLGEVLYLARLMTCPLSIDQSKIHCCAKIQPGVPVPLGEVLYLARLMTCPLAIDQSKIHCWAKIQNPLKENCESMIGKKGFLHCVRTNKKKGIKNT